MSMLQQLSQVQSDVANDVSSAEDVELDSDLIESKQMVSMHSRYYCTLKQERLKDGSVKQSYFYVYVLLLFESLHDSRPMLGAGSSSGVELFQVFMGTRLWQDGADQQVFHCLFIPIFARCLSILVESPFLHKGFASFSPCPEAI